MNQQMEELGQLKQSIDQQRADVEPVSYTHLDVYKRQILLSLKIVPGNDDRSYPIYFPR